MKPCQTDSIVLWYFEVTNFDVNSTTKKIELEVSTSTASIISSKLPKNDLHVNLSRCTVTKRQLFKNLYGKLND